MPRRLKAFDEEPERWIDVTWDIDEDNAQRFPAKIAVTALNEPGSLAQVAAVIGEADGNIDNIKIMKQVPDYAEMVIDLEVWDLTHLNDILRRVARQGCCLFRRAGERLGGGQLGRLRALDPWRMENSRKLREHH